MDYLISGRTVSANDQVGGFLRHKPERCFWLMFLGTTAIKPSTIIIMVRWHYLGHSVFLFVVNRFFYSADCYIKVVDCLVLHCRSF